MIGAYASCALEPTHTVGEKRNMIAKVRITFALALLVSLVVLAAPRQSAQAAASISSYEVTCSKISVEGFSDQPYVALRAYEVFSTDIDGAAIGGQPRIADAWLDGSPTYPVTAGHYSFTFNFSVPEGTPISFRVFGATSSDGHDWDGTPGFESIAATASCSNGYQAEPIPAGFVLRTIVCNTDVYNEPGGTPVGNGTLTADQTWFVSPTPKTVGSQSWTEIFLAGPNDAWIPSACVGAAPAGY
jgi:hypothetical protein